MNRKFTVTVNRSYLIGSPIVTGFLEVFLIVSILFVGYPLLFSIVAAVLFVSFLHDYIPDLMFRVEVDGSEIRVRTNYRKEWELRCSDITRITCFRQKVRKRPIALGCIKVKTTTKELIMIDTMVNFSTMAGYLLEMLENGEISQSAVSQTCKKRLQIHREGFYYERKKKLAKPSAEMKEKTMNVMYNGMPCRLLEYYMQEGDGPYVMIENSSDIDKAYKMGFDCLGYPTEIAKKISKEEYVELCERGYLCSENRNTPE